MIKKFVDEFNNTYIFIESDEKIIMWLNGVCEYTLKEIVSLILESGLPKDIKEASRISGLNIWYPINEIV